MTNHRDQTAKGSWRLRAGIAAGLLVIGPGPQPASATDRLFTYSYEPETMPAEALEFEQWITLSTQRTKKVGQENYSRWDLREEFEYGVTDNYTVALYLNTSAESFRDATGKNQSQFTFKGLSLENKLQVLNPATHIVGLSLYLEPAFAGDEAELEQKIILGQRHGDWKWALNLTHATEWEDNLHATEGEVEGTVGLARVLGNRWAVGLEFRSRTTLPEYNKVESSALFLGPVVSYRQEKWWAALTVMPQIYGANFGENPDDNRHLELEGHERVNIRLVFGLSF